uniref:Uncharacterized protein n=1 Tax=Lepeophtheirus salmonis TaxID=72036 RepID=A0A0K2U6B1_LEPSM
MTACFDSRIRFIMFKVEFHLVTQSRLSFRSGIPICSCVDSSLCVAVVLLWKNSTIALTLSTAGWITFRVFLTIILIVCARHG